MADNSHLEPTGSDEQVVDPTDEAQADIDLETPSGDDLLIEDLDAAAEPYAIAADEDEAEELEGIDPTTDVEDEPETDEMVTDAAELEAAEGEAEKAPSTRPMKRKKARQLAEAEESASDTVAEADEPANTRPVRRTPAKKDAPTRKRDQVAATGEKSRRVGPATFVKESIVELRKTVWPTGSQVSSWFAAVLIFVLFIVFFVWALDSLFGWALLKALG